MVFDVVRHKSKLCKLHYIGIRGDLWELYNDMYSALTSQVKWNGHLSTMLTEPQDLRQGGIASTEIFMANSNDMIQTLS